MDYMETLNDPTLVTGFKELLGDKDVEVVKRTIRAFANVHTHSLSLLAEDKVKEEVLLNAWPYFTSVIDDIFNMFITIENEGILLILVKYLECSVYRHLTSDLTKYTKMNYNSQEYIKRSLRALKELVSTPYVGGSVFIVGIKALIRTACLRNDLQEPVTNLVKKLLKNLPPTLFDHNVRSMNKLLQFNLFRLLKISTCSTLNKILIEMMVSIGASRKSLIPWTPVEVVVPKRKITQENIEAAILGRISPPTKLPKLIQTEKVDKIKAKNNFCPHVPPVNVNKPANSGLQFLTNLLPKPLSKQITNTFDQLTLEKVCSIILSNLYCLPDAMPLTFPDDFSKKTVISENLDVMRKHLAGMLDKQFESNPNNLKLDNPFESNPSTFKIGKQFESNLNPNTSKHEKQFEPNSKFEKSFESNPKCSKSEKQESNISKLDVNKIPFPTQISEDGDSEKKEYINRTKKCPIIDIDMRKIIGLKDLKDIDMRTNSNNVDNTKNRMSPPIVDMKPKNNPESNIVPVNSSKECPRTDPRLSNKRKSPSPEPLLMQNGPTEDSENNKRQAKDPRLQNKPLPRPLTPPETSKNVVRQDPRLTNGNSRLRDPRRNVQSEQENKAPDRIPNENNNNFVSMRNEVINPMLQNMRFPTNTPLNIDFQNRFPNIRDNQVFRPQFNGPVNMERFATYNNLGPQNNFNNYPYYDHGRFQPS